MSNVPYQEPDVNIDGLIPTGGGRNFVNHKIKDGDNIYRILPPFGTNHNGLPMSEWYIHWGFTDHNQQKRPLVCTKKFERYCPICEEANKIREAMDALVREYKTDDNKIMWQAVPKDVAARYNELKEQFDPIKAQRSYYYNALNQGGEVGILRLPKTAMEQLNTAIKDSITRLGFNPLSLQAGASFNIRRVKTGPKTFDVKYEVSLMKTASKDASGNPIEKVERTSVSDDLLNNFPTRVYDIHTLYTVRSAADIKKVMAGDTSVFRDEEIKKNSFKKATPATVAASAPAVTTEEDDMEEAPVTATAAVSNAGMKQTAAPTVTPTSTIVAATTNLDEDPELVELRKKLNL